MSDGRDVITAAPGSHGDPTIPATGHLDGGGHGLQRVLGVPALFSTAYGNVGSSIYYALGLVAAFALGLTPVAFLIAGLIFVMTALTYAEGTTRFPEAGGSSSFARHAFNEFVSFMAAWAQLLNYVITMAISAFFVPHYLEPFWAPLGESPADIVAGMVVIVVLSAVNVVGIKETATLNIALSLADMGMQVTLALLGVFLLLSPSTLVENVHWGVAPELGNFLTGVAVAMIAYTGIETISNMAEETRDPIRSVPRAIMWVVIAVFALYSILPVVALSALPVQEVSAGVYETELGTTHAGNPFLGLVEQFPIEAEWLLSLIKMFVGFVAAVVLLIATNAGIIGVSRLSYSMGQYQQVPDILRRLHPRFATPYFSIGIFGVVGCLLILPGQEKMLANLYAFGAMLSFSVAHASIIRMRLRGGEMPWKAKFNLNVGKTSLPLFAVIGLFGTGSAWFVQVALHPMERYIGLAWMLSGPIGYVWYRRSRGLSLTATVRAPIVIELPSADVTYNNILVPIFGNRVDHRAMVAACKMAAERAATIVAVSVVEVPQSLPLDAYLGQVVDEANRQLDIARAIGEEYGVRVLTRIVRARRAERAILEELEQRRSQIVVLGLPRRRLLLTRTLPRSIERIIHETPGRVLLVGEGPKR